MVALLDYYIQELKCLGVVLKITVFKMDEVDILKGYNRSGILTEVLLRGSKKFPSDRDRG